jgi:hypothetical protein
LAEPKNLRASAPIMPIPAFAVTCDASRDVVHQIAYQLTVTHPANARYRASSA